MARVHLDLPSDFSFAIDILIRVTDINFAGHLGNDSLISFLQEARSAFFAHHGFGDMDIFGAGIVIADLVVVYESEAFRGEILKIEVTLDEFNPYGCDIFYRLMEKKENRPVARAKTGIVFFDYQARRIRPIPEPFRALFEQGSVAV